MASRRRKSKKQRLADKDAGKQQLQAANLADQQQQTEPAETAKDPDSQLADDFMFGWNTKNDLDREAFGLAVAHGQMDPDGLAEFRSLGLLRGFEELDMMLACANSLLRKDANPEPLDGQDILTYVTQLLGGSSQKPVSSGQSESELAQQQAPAASAGDSKQNKRKRGENSPYFAEDEIPESIAKKIAKRSRKQARRQARGSAFAAQLEPTDASLAAQHHPTVLQDATTWYLGSGNDKDKDAAQDNEGPQDDDEGRDGNHAQGLSTTRPADDHRDVEREDPMGGYNIQIQEFDTAVDRQSPHPGTCDAVESTVNGDESTLSDSLQATLVGSEQASYTIDKPPRRVLRSSTCTPKRINSSKFFEAVPKVTSPTKTKSPRPPKGTVSALPFPTLFAQRFGLVQEELADDPFRLLIAVTFLVKTSGKAAIPVFRTLMDTFRSPEALAEAAPSEIAAMIKHLGLSVVQLPPAGDGSDIRAGEELPPEGHDDSRTSAWEIGHMTQGAYAIDSWRIFCRDVLLGRAQDWKGKGREGEFQPEWMRVLPQDKELRAYLRWMWMQEGWAWDPVTGDKEVLSEQLRSAVNEGRVAWDNTGNLEILTKGEEGGTEDGVE
ncbi:hypothetical protein PG985_015371 [Apiospora marii]|uniref:uncharacterized protein n=1 Tax=Apiospora marii TaxID=335849 RepID=UPI00312CEA5E